MGRQALAKEGLMLSTKHVYKAPVSKLCDPPFRCSLFNLYVLCTTALVLRHASPRACVCLEIFLGQSH